MDLTLPKIKKIQDGTQRSCKGGLCHNKELDPLYHSDRPRVRATLAILQSVHAGAAVTRYTRPTGGQSAATTFACGRHTAIGSIRDSKSRVAAHFKVCVICNPKAVARKVDIGSR